MVSHNPQCPGVVPAQKTGSENNFPEASGCNRLAVGLEERAMPQRSSANNQGGPG